MTDMLKPREPTDVEAAVRWALGEGKAVEIAGAGSKRAIGRPSQTDLTLDLSHAPASAQKLASWPSELSQSLPMTRASAILSGGSCYSKGKPIGR